MSPIGLLLALLVGVSLGFFGGGGSILTVPLLVYVFGLDPKVAIASSLLIVAAASISGAVQHWRAGNLRLKTGLLFGAAGMAGAYLGGRAGALVDGRMLLLLFAAMMGFTALAMWRGRRAPAPGGAGRGAAAKLALQGFAVGVFTGLVGAGGGFLVVPALVLWAGLPMPAAVGTSLFVIVLKSVGGFSGYLAHVSVDYRLVAAVAVAAIIGSLAGTRLARVIAPETLRRAFAVFVLIMAAAILVREGRLVAQTFGAALPTTIPQLLFVLAMLAVGAVTGRSTRTPRDAGTREVTFQEGEGI